jgi:beta-carotene hydroxylase
MASNEAADLGTGIPRPPSHFLRPSTWQTVAFLSYATALALLPGLAAHRLWLVGGIAWPWLVLTTLGLLVLSGYGYFLLGISAHEGYHFTLHRRPATSALLGVLFSAVLPGFIGTGFAYSHWHHHRHTNQAGDPDLLQFSRFRGFWSRLLLARLSAVANYRRIALHIVLGQTSDDSDAPQLPAATLRRLCAINIVWQAALVGLALWALLVHTQLALLVFLLPIGVTVMISGLNPFQEHCETGQEVGNRARTRTSWVLTLLMGGTNYHMEHHLYPRIPCWRLPAVHRWLRETPWYRQRDVVVVQGLLGTFSPRILSRAAVYGARSPQPALVEVEPALRAPTGKAQRG